MKAGQRKNRKYTGPFLPNYGPRLQVKAVCHSRGTPHFSGFPDLNDQLQRKRKRNKVESGVIRHQVCVCVCDFLPWFPCGPIMSL